MLSSSSNKHKGWSCSNSSSSSNQEMSYEQKVHKKREILEFVLFRQNPKYLEVCCKNVKSML